jgi:hypothetical protein
LANKHGEQKARDHLRRHGADHKHAGVDQGIPVGRGRDVVGQYLDVIVQTHEADGLLVRLVSEK